MEQPFIVFKSKESNEVYISKIIFGNMEISITKKFNWLNKIMFKIFFNIKIENFEILEKD